MALRTQIRGQEQIQDNTVDIGRLIQDFLGGANWNITSGGNNATIVGLSAGVANNDAVNVGQMNSAIQSALDALAAAHLDPVETIATTNITLSGLTAVNGYTPSAGDRIGVFGQSTATEDGIYEAAAGAWTRTTDAALGNDLAGKVFAVNEGTDADTLWMITNATGAGVVGTDDLTVVKVGEAGAATATKVWGELPLITNGSPTVTLANTPDAGTERVYLNGSRMARGGSLDYTITGAVITFAENLRTTPAPQADLVVVDYEYN